MKAKLICLDAVAPVGEVLLEKFPAMIGRIAEADVCLPDTWTSRRHCEINWVNGSLLVRELGSSNGTLVNGAYVTEAPLLPDDRLTVGITTFQVSYERDDSALPSPIVDDTEDGTNRRKMQRTVARQMAETMIGKELIETD